MEKASPPATANESELWGFILNGSKQNGKRQAMDVALVIKTVDVFFPPLSCNIMELFTEVPNKSIKAMIEFMLSDAPKINRAAAAPKKLGGTAVK